MLITENVISLLPEGERERLFQLLQAHDRAKAREAARTGFMAFVKNMWPGFIEGRHHRIMADAFERIASGKLKRVIINMAPRHTKSEFASYLFPAWFLGKYPDRKVIQASHTAELSVGFGRKVRNLVNSEIYTGVFNNTKLQADSKAAGRWQTDLGGEYFAIGVGGALAGKGADLLIIDDPHTEQDAVMGMFSPETYNKAYEWYTTGPRQRLQPGAAICIVMCMTGDTMVLRPNGTESRLDTLRPGDAVATYDNGGISTSTIANWRSSGVDDVFTIQTRSGRTLRANERHPFLVEEFGDRRWVRLKDLKPGMSLVAVRGVGEPQGLKRSPGCVQPVRLATATTVSTLKRRITRLVTTASGLASSVAAALRHGPRGFAGPVIRQSTARPFPRQSSAVPDGSSLAMASLMASTCKWSMTVLDFAMSAVKGRMPRTPVPTGTVFFASTTATKLERSGGFSATTATSQSPTAKTLKSLSGLPTTYDVILDEIMSITFSGREEVFDVEVAGTENFIASGVVSHNTRWSKADLTGRLLEKGLKERGASEWEVIELPALLPSGDPMWPEFWTKGELEAVKADIPVGRWNAQYMQTPTSEEGALIKRDWWRVWKQEKPPKCDSIIVSWDTAFETKSRSDYSACTTWGVFSVEGKDGKQHQNLILLDAFRDKMEFPELKRIAKKHYDFWNPDAFVIEASAAGLPLIQEMRAYGIPVEDNRISRTNDKKARVNAVSDMFRSGFVWHPDQRWAEEVIEECAEFPNGTHDDYVDSVSQALLRARRGGLLLESDFEFGRKLDDPSVPVDPY